MGLFDSCIQRLPSESSGFEPYTPTDETCQNCHESPPSETACPSQIDWPETLYRPIEAIAREPERLRWWVQENRLRTDLRRRAREEVFPVELGAHTMRIEIDPNERNLDSTFVDSDTRLFMNLSGEGMRIFLNSSRLVEARDLGWIGSLRIFFEDNHLTSDSTLLNWFVPPHSNVLSMIPVAYNEASGTTYDYTQYTRMALIQSQCGAPTAPEAYTSFDGGVPPPSEAGLPTMDGSVSLDLPPEILSEMRRSAPNLGTGYADAGCGYSEALPRRFPYLFELAHHFATSHSQASRIDLLRLYPDLLLLQRLNAQAPSSGGETDFMSFLDRVRVDWNVAPARVVLQNFLLEFHPDTAEHPLSVGMEVRGRRLPSLETDSRIHLSRLYVPGWIHLGETRARLQGTGPELSLHLTEIQGEILPFDLGQEDPAARGFLHIRGGSASDGEEREFDDRVLRPGIHLQTESDGGIRYSVNLRVSWNVELSDGRVLSLSGNLAVSGRLLEREGNFEPEPESTVMALQDLRLAPERPDGESSAPEAWVQGASLVLTDRSEDSEESGFSLNLDIPQTSSEAYRGGRAEIFFPIPVENSRYRPDFSFQDFSSTLNFDLLGRGTARDGHGTLTVSTRQVEDCIRTYEALLDVDRVGVPAGSGLLLYLSPLRGHLQVTQELSDTGVSHFEVPVLDFSANRGPGSRRGILRGPVSLRQAGGERRPLELTYDPHSERLDLRNLNLRFLMERIVVPALVESSREERGLPPQVTGIDVDGSFRGRWSLDTATGRGRGDLCLVGDGADVVFRGSDGRPMADPLMSDTRWCASSVSRADTARDILWGNFFFDTTIDWGLLRYLGIHLNMRVRARMAHDNLPYSPRGYSNLERIFFRRVFQEHRRDALTRPEALTEERR